MEPASLGVILDSSVVIEAERQHLNVAQFLKQIVQTIGEMEAALCATRSRMAPLSWSARSARSPPLLA